MAKLKENQILQAKNSGKLWVVTLKGKFVYLKSGLRELECLPATIEWFLKLGLYKVANRA